MCLKNENYCLKTFVKICVVKKCVKICERLFKNWKWWFENTNQTLPKFVEELKEALDADIQDRIMKEREMQSYIQEREREAAWKAELSRCEVTPFPFLCFSLFPIFLFTLRLSIPIITNSCLTIQKVLVLTIK